AGSYRATFWFQDGIVAAPRLLAQAAGLAPASQVETIVCPVLVDGAPCDDQDLCNGHESCQSGICSPGLPLNCDDGERCTTDRCDAVAGCEHALDAMCCRTPLIAQEANLDAAQGVPYRYSPSGRASLEKGTGPTLWTTCDAPPPELHLDVTTGQVDWIPATAGPQDLCLHARGACDPPDEYRFTVT